MVDVRKLLKDTIRGQVWDCDLPALPATIDADGEAAEMSREELNLFFEVLGEIIEEDGGEPRLSIRREFIRLREQAYAELDAA